LPSPAYGPAAYVIYNTGGPVGTGNEWPSSNTIPNLNIEGRTVLNIGIPSVSNARIISGNVIVGVGSRLSLNEGGHQRTAPLNIGGSITSDGEIDVSSQSGGIIVLNGTYTGGPASLFRRNGQKDLCPLISATIQNTSGCNAYDGSINITVQSYFLPVYFNWTGTGPSAIFPTNQNQIDLFAGNFTLSISETGTDGSGCNFISNFEINGQIVSCGYPLVVDTATCTCQSQVVSSTEETQHNNGHSLWFLLRYDILICAIIFSFIF